jgi:hypothetical protein
MTASSGKCAEVSIAEPCTHAMSSYHALLCAPLLSCLEPVDSGIYCVV